MMQTYVALLRGINVSGQKKFPKAEQVALLESLKVMNPQVYLHTGNWIFSSEKEASALENDIHEAVFANYNWKLPIVVKSASEIKQIMERCPFQNEQKEKSYFTLLHCKPKDERLQVAEGYEFPGEIAHITPQCVYVFFESGAGKAKMNNNWFESKLKVSATSRNFNTMTKILKLMQE